MRIERAGSADVRDLARLRWVDRSADPVTDRALAAFERDLSAWWDSHRETHFAFVARSADATVVGAAWVALVHRTPSPGAGARLSADIQSVFVMPEHRDAGVGSALIEAARRHALDSGATRITVHSSERAVPVYTRLGFRGSATLLQYAAEK